MAEHIVMLADLNSVITPGMDTEVPTPHDDLPPTARAREMESAFLAELALGDAWTTAFKPSMDPEAHHIPKGWTWGFHMEKPHLVTVDPQRTDTPLDQTHDTSADQESTKPHLRQIDKVHLSQHMQDAL